MRTNWVEPNYLDLLGIELIAGSNFSNHRDSLSGFKVIISQRAANEYGFTPERVVGERLFREWQGVRYEFEVIGVMEDYHQEALREEIFPVLFHVPEEPDYNHLVIDAKPEDFSATISAVEKTWRAINPDTPFEYSFLDDDIKKQYEEDQKVSTIITSFTVIAMIISCLGLYGLSSFMAERRFKEIGVRKVMGASVQQIVGMMSGEFVRLVLIAFVISIPLAWYAITSWLEKFAYRTQLDVSVFVFAGSVSLLVALVTISFESVRAASSNPVDSLRSE
jgi:putative ABC transport system permease protein